MEVDATVIEIPVVASIMSCLLLRKIISRVYGQIFLEGTFCLCCLFIFMIHLKLE